MSLKLPRHLASWEPQMRIFPEDIALALAPLALKVAALVGVFPHRPAEGHAIPDGFSGLAKRGSYERLIASDWLLADELPEEFMRRSVMGEHLFWKFAYREPAQSRSTVVLFDEGPEQLGAPRILHLAALAVFEARARRARADFQWGILQDADVRLMPGMNVAEVNHLLNARGVMTAGRDDVAAWSRLLANNGPDEVWVVGSERTQALLPPDFSSLCITEPAELDVRKLRAECRPRGKHSRTIELDLPPSRDCVQLLRDPFATTVVQPQQIQDVPEICNLVLNPPGNRLWLKTASGEVLAVPVANSPRHPAGSVRNYETLSRFPQVAVGKAGRSTVLVSMDPVSLTFRVRLIGGAPVDIAGDGDYEFIHSQTKPIFKSNSLALCVWHNVIGRKPGLYLIDEGGLLLRIFKDATGQRCEVVHHHALALTRCRTGMSYVAFNAELNSICVYVGNHEPVQHWRSEIVPERVFVGHGPHGETAMYGQVAFGYSRTHWEIHNLKGHSVVSVPDDFVVHGVVQDRNYEPTLIVVESDGCTLSLHGAHGTRKLFKASAPIMNVSACLDVPHIAWSTESGGISVYSLRHSAPVVSLMRKDK